MRNASVELNTIGQRKQHNTNDNSLAPGERNKAINNTNSYTNGVWLSPFALKAYSRKTDTRAHLQWLVAVVEQQSKNNARSPKEHSSESIVGLAQDQ